MHSFDKFEARNTVDKPQINLGKLKAYPLSLFFLA
jgi:hypothetical protein